MSAARLGALALAAMSLALLVVLAGRSSSPASVDQRAREIAGALRCPVCQNLTVADSPSELATQMRAVIVAKVAAGESRQDILDYFVDRYGEDVLLDPPKRGFGLLVWAGPPLLLALGGAVVGLAMAGWRGRAGRVPNGPTATTEESAVLVARLRRDLADGVDTLGSP